MDYIKFNCYDIAAQSAELETIFRKVQNFREKLSGIYEFLDDQVKNYESIQTAFMAADSGTADLVMRISNEYAALEQIVDLYYAAESKAKKLSEGLPTAIQADKKLTASHLHQITESTIIGSDLVLEDWLAALIYKREIKEL